MKKILSGFIGCLLLVSSTVWAEDALYFYNLGLNTSFAFQKIRYFTKALELNPKLTEAYEKRGLLYYDQGKYTKTIQDFLAFAKLKPFKPSAYVMLGLAYMEKGDYDRALDKFNRAIALNPQLMAAYSYISEAYRLKGMSGAAIKNATKAIELGGASRIVGKAYATRAKTYRSLGKDKLADEDFKKALRLSPEYHDYTFFTVTEYLADSAAESSSIKRVGLIGACMIIALAFVGIFKLALPSPKKDNKP